MMLPALVFAAVLAIVLGAYWLLVMRDEQRVLRRLQPKLASRRKRLNVLKPKESMSSVGTIDRALRTRRFTEAIQMFLDQAAVKMTVSVFLLATGCGVVVFFLIGTIVARLPIVGLIVAPIGGALPFLFVRRARNKRVRKFEEQFPEAIDLVARALRAGHALPTGLGMVADELKAPVGREFRILFDEQNFGLTLPDALRNFARRVPVLDARFFVTAVMTQRETGGNLAEVLDNLGTVIRERFKVKRQVRVLSAHGRITGFVLAMLPPALAVATFMVSPSHLGTLLHDPLGQRMIIVAIVLQILGTLTIRKLVNIEY